MFPLRKVSSDTLLENYITKITVFLLRSLEKPVLHISTQNRSSHV